MIPDRIRAAVRLEPGMEPDAVLAAIEERLGRCPRQVWRLGGGRVLSLWIGRGELELIRQIPGVRSAQEEGKFAPPHPALPRREEK